MLRLCKKEVVVDGLGMDSERYKSETFYSKEKTHQVKSTK